MKTNEEREAEFRKDLDVVLTKHSAWIGLRIDGLSFMQNEVIEITLEAKRDEKTGDIIKNEVEFDL